MTTTKRLSHRHRTVTIEFQAGGAGERALCDRLDVLADEGWAAVTRLHGFNAPSGVVDLNGLEIPMAVEIWLVRRAVELTATE